MKKSDLHREYARCIDMCEGTKVDPLRCVKIDDEVYRGSECPAFSSINSRYTFSLAIVEGKPVFNGDVLYAESGTKCTVPIVKSTGQIMTFPKNHKWSWNPPKPETVMVELLREDALTLAEPLSHRPFYHYWSQLQENVAQACKKALG